MGLFRITSDKLEPVPRTSFAIERLMERRDLQRLLHQGISPRDEQRSKAVLDALAAQKTEIAQAFGESLEWPELPGRNSYRIYKETKGGWKSPESEWPEMQDWMIDTLIRLEKALRKPVQELNV